MLLVAERSDVRQRAGYRWCRTGDTGIQYQVDDTEYCYEDDRLILLLDTTFDQSRRNVIERLVRQLSIDLADGREVKSLPLVTYFAVLVDKIGRKITLLRDVAGIKSGYYGIRTGFLCVGNNVHQVARESGATEFDDNTIHQLLYLNYTFDGFTYYRDVREVLIGATMTFDDSPTVIDRGQRRLKLADADNGLSFKDNVLLLRDNIVAAHERQAAADNVVLLSGGLDSAVMLIALHEVAPDRVRAVSFQVKGTDEDETVYARSIADHLGVKCDIVEVDPEDENNFADFESRVPAMNNPYVGMWIFGNLGRPSDHQTFFAGQDTRLHTPDLNPVDKLAFHMFGLWQSPSGRTAMSGLHRVLSAVRPEALVHSNRRWLRGISRAVDALNVPVYLLKYFFHVCPEDFPADGPWRSYYEAARDFFTLDINRIRTQRQLYNEIVRLKWQQQYTDDIRYLQDLARLRGTYIAMPFYDPQLAEFSSAIPFRQATRFIVGHDRYTTDRVLINKYLLRMAFRDRLNDDIFFRQKAVSSSMYLLFNGALGRIIDDIIRRDLGSDDSFLRKYGQYKTVLPFLHPGRWVYQDEKYLLKIYTLATLCLFKTETLQYQGDQVGAVTHHRSQDPPA
ncbi:MAG: asparagine synthase-related protein [bacterium]